MVTLVFNVKKSGLADDKHVKQCSSGLAEISISLWYFLQRDQYFVFLWFIFYIFFL